MTKLAALALAALVLAGCGTQAMPGAAVAPGAMTASATRPQVHTYGSFVKGPVLVVKLLSAPDGQGGTYTYQQLTVDATSSRPFNGKGKIVFTVPSDAPRVKVGQVVETFVSYTLIEAGRFVNTPGRPYQAGDLTIDG